jgi:hypothetical protein
LASASDLVRHRLTELVLERQQLRDQRASEVLLEQNRLDIVHAQQELASALLSEHVPASAA